MSLKNLAGVLKPNVKTINFDMNLSANCQLRVTQLKVQYKESFHGGQKKGPDFD